MPVRSLNSSVLKWPDAATTHKAVRDWAIEQAANNPEIVRIGFFGSYAEGNWGVGSDLDLVMVVKESLEPFERRACRWDTTSLPVPADLLVFTEQEWEEGWFSQKFNRIMRKKVVWVYPGEKR
ncbi:MAG: nucleotidyltransferase domain-containing protein [Verrucomicrobiota bacterium]